MTDIEKLNFVKAMVWYFLKRNKALFKFKEDLENQAYIFLLEAEKGFDPSKGTDFKFWLKLKVHSGLKKYIQRKIYPLLYQESFDDYEVSIDYQKIYEANEMYNKLTDFDKFILKVVFVDGRSVDYIAKKYKLPRIWLKRYVHNLHEFLKRGYNGEYNTSTN